MNHPIAQVLHHHLLFKEQLREQFPDENDESLADTLEGMSDLPEMLATVLRSSLDDMAVVDALQSRITDMNNRRERIKSRSDKKRQLVLDAMEKAGLKKITEPDMTVSLKPLAQPLVVTDENKIPDEYWKLQPSTLDRKKIKDALKANEEIPGAILGNGGISITVRTK